MKTKIIYISGNEVFDMTEIRAAFEEVRNALGLDKDTVLFGVPVDSDNAIESTVQTHITETPTAVCNTEETIQPIENTDVYINNTENLTDDIDPLIPANEPEDVISINEIDNGETTTDSQITTENNEYEIEKETVIPILSILSVKENNDEITEQDTNQIEENEKNTESVTVIETVEEEYVVEDDNISTTVNIDTEIVVEAENNEDETNTTSIEDMINDEAPTKPIEKTLEQLLESMTPLREDHSSEYIEQISDADENFDDFSDDDDTDATLAQLASEFVQTEQTIEIPKKNESHGKIGKLKNILPFKKAKRDDGGLMGDLFGWAGIAANDDDFSIPGFFTKKQGA
jgi:hypothetical protein